MHKVCRPIGLARRGGISGKRVFMRGWSVKQEEISDCRR